MPNTFSNRGATAQDMGGEEHELTGHVRSSIEKSLVLRLDCFLMFFGCVSQIIKYLDQVRW